MRAAFTPPATLAEPRDRTPRDRATPAAAPVRGRPEGRPLEVGV